MRFDAFFFDLDGTLYDRDCGLIDRLSARIDEWILKTLYLPAEEVAPLRKRLAQRYGGTLPGLAIEYGSDYYASLVYCHDVPVEEYVRPNPELRRILDTLPCRKYVFTSSWRVYAVRVLKALDVLDRFDAIIDVMDTFPKVKPAPESFRKALEITIEPDPSRCVFLDDHASNVDAAHREGFFAVQVGRYASRAGLADASILKIEDLFTIPAFDPKA